MAQNMFINHKDFNFRIGKNYNLALLIIEQIYDKIVTLPI